MVVDELGHDGDGHGSRTFVKDLGNVLVLQTNHVLSVHFTQVVVDKEAVPEREKYSDKERGCGWQGELGTLDSHVQSCPMRDGPLMTELLKLPL